MIYIQGDEILNIFTKLNELWIPILHQKLLKLEIKKYILAFLHIFHV